MNSRCAVILGVALLFLLQVAAAASAAAEPLERSLFENANRERFRAGLPELKWDDKLMATAREHAEKMAAAHMLAHRVSGEPELTQRVAATKLRFSTVGENIAYTSDPQDIHSSWMQSEGHRANILSSKFNALGVGIFHSGNLVYAVEDFAKVSSEDDAVSAEKRLASAFHSVAQKNGQRGVNVASSALLRRAACEMSQHDKVSAKLIPLKGSANGALAFTVFDPDDVPKAMLDLDGNQKVKIILMGACFARSKSYPGGVYWFAITY